MELYTERLYIRSLESKDCLALREIILDELQSPYVIYDRPLPTNQNDLQVLVDVFSLSGLFFVVYLKGTDQMIGYICFHEESEDLNIGYCFHSAYQKKGYAFEGCHALMNHFSNKQFRAGAALKNTPSCKLLEKLGFVLIGREQVSFYKDENGNNIYFDGGIFRTLPKAIENEVKGEPYTNDDIGMSGSSIRVYDSMVLKIQSYTDEVKKEILLMEWLNGKINVPKVIHHIVQEDMSYLLMTKMPGKMACDIDYLENSDELLKLLVDGLRQLWKIDASNCPVSCVLEEKLKMAKYNVDHHLVDTENCDPNTFGENGFKDPMALYLWLEAHQPEEDLVLSHGDYCLPNVFGNKDQLSGFIDIGRMGKADRWQDIALCYRSLRDNMNGSYGGKVYDFDPDKLFKVLGIEKNEEKLKYYLLMDELF